MSAEELMDRLALMGVTLAAEGGRLKVTAPLGAVSPSLRAEMKQAKPALLAHVSGAGPTGSPAGSPLATAGTGGSPEGIGLSGVAVVGIIAVVILMVWLASRTRAPGANPALTDPFQGVDQRPFTSPFGRPPGLGW